MNGYMSSRSMEEGLEIARIQEGICGDGYILSYLHELFRKLDKPWLVFLNF